MITDLPITNTRFAKSRRSPIDELAKSIAMPPSSGSLNSVGFRGRVRSSKGIGPAIGRLVANTTFLA